MCVCVCLCAVPVLTCVGAQVACGLFLMAALQAALLTAGNTQIQHKKHTQTADVHLIVRMRRQEVRLETQRMAFHLL